MNAPTRTATISIEEGVLTQGALTRAGITPQALEQQRDGVLVIDASRVERVELEGLATLIDLLVQRGTTRVRLVGLQGELLRAALETSLAELADIWVRPPPRDVKRWVIIREQEDLVGLGCIDVAGQPLLVRQLQWLRTQGLEDVVVEVACGWDPTGRADLLLGSDPLVSRVVVVPTGAPVPVQALADRAGLDEETWFLELEAGALPLDAVELSLRDGEPQTLRLRPADELHGRPVELAFRSRELIAEKPLELDAKGATIENVEAAHSIGCAALSGRYPSVQIHGSDVHGNQIWTARGVSISSLAKLKGPLYLGAGAVVLDHAEVGPLAVIGAGSVLERGTLVSGACVAANTIVGEGVKLKNGFADARGILAFADQTRSSVVDTLVLARHHERTTPLSSRLVALLLLLLVALPWLLGALVSRARGRNPVRIIERSDGEIFRAGTTGLRALDAGPALLDVIVGVRDLVGVADERALEQVAKRRDLLAELRGGALDIALGLSPSGDTDGLLRMWRWYGRRKTDALDRQLMRARRVPTGRSRRQASAD